MIRPWVGTTDWPQEKPCLWDVSNKHSKTSFEKNCFSAWASTLNMGLINKSWYGMFAVTCVIWCLADVSSVSPSSEQTVCSDEGLTLETSAKHHIPQATNIPYQPLLIKPVSNKDYYLRRKRERVYKQMEEKLETERAVIQLSPK